jgi:hypothetical protein
MGAELALVDVVTAGCFPRSIPAALKALLAFASIASVNVRTFSIRVAHRACTHAQTFIGVGTDLAVALVAFVAYAIVFAALVLTGSVR